MTGAVSTIKEIINLVAYQAHPKGDIVAIQHMAISRYWYDTSGMLIVVTKDGDHYHYPERYLYRVKVEICT